MNKNRFLIIYNLIFKTYPKLSVFSLIFVILTVLLELPLPLFTMYFIDTIIPGKNLYALHAMGIILVLLLFTNTIVNYLRTYFSILLSQKVTMENGLKALNNLLNCNYQFVQNNSTGYWYVRVIQDTQDIGNAFENLVNVITQFFTFLIGLVLTFYFCWQLGFAIILLIPFYILSLKFLNPKIKSQNIIVKDKGANLGGLFEESLSNLIEIKTLFLEKIKHKQVKQQWESAIDANINYIKLTTITSLTANFIASIGSIAVLWFGGFLVISNSLTLGKLIALNRFLGYVISPLRGFMGINQQLQRIFVSFDRLQEIAQFLNKTNSDPRKIFYDIKDQSICLENLSFAYNNSQKVFTNISAILPITNFTCFSAPSGYGKSTIFKLIAGLLVPEKGEIKINVYNKIEKDDIILVPQNALLFNASYVDNILLDRNISRNKVLEISECLELNDLISKLSNGIDTELGSLNGKISGGEKQRIALARAIVTDPYILLIDEMTSDIDVETERKIFLTLQKTRKDKITLFITHRETSLNFADSVIYLDKLLKENDNKIAN